MFFDDEVFEMDEEESFDPIWEFLLPNADTIEDLEEFMEHDFFSD